jgi:TPR repeat protein
MKRIFVFVAALILGSLSLTSARAQNLNAYCKGVANGVAGALLGDGGVIKELAVIAQNHYCGPVGSGGRWQDLSLAYRRFQQAAAHGNGKQITEAARNLQHVAYGTSSMMTSCWNTLLSDSNKVSNTITNGMIVFSGGVCAFKGL